MSTVQEIIDLLEGVDTEDVQFESDPEYDNSDLDYEVK